ncbi:LLM class flavin-dependent oxidoreductase [Kitasatospora sp. NPDC051170]|uniref:LLM class flavin-dependent oxidoreductase n=1 Tax=Kitasatospora sp. NPDC051170 TaxID=3364056 RepID=UPI0037A1EAE8
MTAGAALRLAVALDGVPGGGPVREGPLPPQAWSALAAEAERGLLDLLTLDDAHGPAPDGGPRPEALQLAAALGASTRWIGIAPTVTPTHAEPFHLSTGLATLDFVTTGRAAALVRPGLDRAEDRNAGRLPTGRAERFAETEEAVEVIRALWDSWEEGAEIRDAATGRFLDRSRVRPIHHRGRRFAVRGPSITPRPPQGRPPVLVAVRDEDSRRLAARCADLALLTAADRDDARAQVEALRAAEAEVRRPGPPLLLFADRPVALDTDPRRALARTPAGPGSFAGTPEAFADSLLAWRSAGLDGVRLLPAAPERDLPGIVRGLVPELQARGVFRRRYEGATLRARLGLPDPGKLPGSLPGEPPGDLPGDLPVGHLN